MIASRARQNKARCSTKTADGWRRSAPQAGRSTVEKEAKSRQGARFFRLPALIAPIRGARSAKPMGIARRRP